MASLKEILSELRQVEISVSELAAEIYLYFTSASEVRRQILNIQLAQNKLNQIKRELQKRQSGASWEISWQSLANSTGKTFSEDLGAALADSLLGLDPEERRKHLQREQRMLRNQIQTKLCHTIPTSIEQHIKRGDQLVALGYEYLKNPSKARTRLRAEKRQKLQAKLFVWGIVFAVIGLLLLISMVNGGIDGSVILAFLVVSIGLVFFAFENVRRDFS